MEKFLSIPVTDEQYQLVRANDIIIVEQASTTTVTIAYRSAIATSDILTITHATAGAGDETMRDAIQDAILDVHKQRWNEPSKQCDDLPYAVSGIALA